MLAQYPDSCYFLHHTLRTHTPPAAVTPMQARARISCSCKSPAEQSSKHHTKSNTCVESSHNTPEAAGAVVAAAATNHGHMQALMQPLLLQMKHTRGALHKLLFAQPHNPEPSICHHTQHITLCSTAACKHHTAQQLPASITHKPRPNQSSCPYTAVTYYHIP
jgi:hypothetical protein